MKKVHKLMCATMVVFLLLPSIVSMAVFDDFNDVSGHWAESHLRQAYDDGLLTGIGNYLYPDDDITTAQALTILCRVLGAEVEADISDMGLSANAWYYEYVSKAVYLGLITSVDATILSAPITREDAFYMLAEAFQLIDADPDMSSLQKFYDSDFITDDCRQALASLISKGLVVGNYGKLSPTGSMTRAAFVTMIYRIIGGFLPSEDAGGDYEYSVLLQGPSMLSGGIFDRGVWFDCAASNIRLDDVDTDVAIIRSNTLDSLVISGSTRIGTLTLASQYGDVYISPEGDAVIDTLVVGTGHGTVSTRGIGTVEITGNGRYVFITDSVDTVIVSGHHNTICIEDGAWAGKIDILMSAYSSRIITDGDVSNLEIKSIGSTVSGNGSVDMLVLRRANTLVSVTVSNEIIETDLGITDATVRMSAPAFLPIGDTLSANATIVNAAPGTVCGLTWYIDNDVVMDTSIKIGDKLPELTHVFQYSRGMKESAEIKVIISYMTVSGELQELSALSTVDLENYDKQHWMESEAERVLREVNLGYSGDYTLDYALAHDIDDFDKEIWINAKGYSSATNYLLWINLANQRVNVFKWSDGAWALIRTCLVGTGRPGHGTPPGVWTTSYKQLEGWTTGTYTVKPVVRFMGSIGYAFHSRLYYPGTTTIQDPSIGYPISLGCIRMYDEDIWFIYDNIPNGTTVVVY